jgi:hypothetical protein
MEIKVNLSLNNDEIDSKLRKGINFYLEKQFHGGRSFWRWPKEWPIDIHHQAQGIITFSKYYKITREEKFNRKALEILDFTLNNFKKKNNSYSYQKWPIFSNKIEYMRWSNCWMLLAMSEYIDSQTKKNIT